MSIGDQYLVRGGAAFPIPGTTTMFRGGVRAEGVKVKDLFGGSDGFRRPGIAVSLEPTFNFGKGDNAFSFGVPFAIYRNRKVSVPDEARGAHGDAAFADYLIMADTLASELQPQVKSVVMSLYSDSAGILLVRADSRARPVMVRRGRRRTS